MDIRKSIDEYTLKRLDKTNITNKVIKEWLVVAQRVDSYLTDNSTPEFEDIDTLLVATMKMCIHLLENKQ